MEITGDYWRLLEISVAPIIAPAIEYQLKILVLVIGDLTKCISVTKT